MLVHFDKTSRKEVSVYFEKTSARYVRVVAKNFGKIPEGNPGAGSMPWLFVDEISID